MVHAAARHAPQKGREAVGEMRCWIVLMGQRSQEDGSVSLAWIRWLYPEEKRSQTVARYRLHVMHFHMPSARHNSGLCLTARPSALFRAGPMSWYGRWNPINQTGEGLGRVGT